MMTLPIFEAKTRLSELLTAVEQGEQVVITRHGQPVAKLVAMGGEGKLSAAEIKSRKHAMQRVMDARLQLDVGDFDFRAAAEEGRD